METVSTTSDHHKIKPLDPLAFVFQFSTGCALGRHQQRLPVVDLTKDFPDRQTPAHSWP